MDLQEVVQRVLTDALGAQAEHLADIARRDELHLDETERRDELHMAEANRRGAAHLEEVNRRDEHYHDERARDVERHASEIDQLEMALAPIPSRVGPYRPRYGLSGAKGPW